jgi:hypothetical protein
MTNKPAVAIAEATPTESAPRPRVTNGQTLNDRIRAKTAELDTADYTEVANALYAELDTKEIRAALKAILPNRVRTVLVNRLVRSVDRLAHAVGRPAKSTARSKDEAPVTRSGPSKADLIRLHYRRELHQPVHTKAGNKFLGDCTIDDLTFAAVQRRDQADDLNRNAEAFEELVKAMSNRNVAVVRDLPEDVFASAWGAGS